jgi:hypothetical protein
MKRTQAINQSLRLGQRSPSPEESASHSNSHHDIRDSDRRVTTSAPDVRLCFILLFLSSAFWTAPVAAQSSHIQTSSSSAPLSADYPYPSPTPLAQPFSLPPKSLFSSSLSLSGDILSAPLHDKGNTTNAYTPIIVQPGPESTSDTKFRWRFATSESLLFTGIMHAYNLGTQAGTRDALNGQWFDQYLQSVSELRGWSDSDTFMAPYVGHTIEGSVFGYIERQNDPKYRNVRWGDGRDYFISLLRSLAFSAVWHTQWKIGPISEASLGNVMLHASPGFITLTDTPTLGAVAQIAEDAADRYLLMGLENRTANRTLISAARSFLNPGRAFANVMAFKVPWHRDTRIGIWGENFNLRKELLADYKRTGEKPFEFVPRTALETSTESPRTYPLEAPIELTAFPYYETFLGGGSCVGGGGSGAARVNPSWQVIAEVSGCLIMHMPKSNQSGDSLDYGGGARWTPHAAHRVSPYIEFRFGGKKVTHETDNIALRNELMKAWDDGNGPLGHYPKRSDWSVEVSNNGPSIVAGGGFDVVITRPFAWRVVNLEYSHTWMSSVAMIHPQNGLRISTSAVIRIGTW